MASTNKSVEKLAALMAESVEKTSNEPSIGRLFGRPLDSLGVPASIKTVSELGQTIQQSRRRLNLNQTELAEQSGVGRRFLSELESGKATVELGKVLAVCAALGIDLVARSRG